MNATTAGRILGALGLVILLTSPFTLLLTGGEGWLAGGKAVLGALLIAVYLATHWRRLGQLASKRSTSFFLSSALWVGGLLGVLVALNYLAARNNRTWDFTTQQLNSLAPQTRSTLHGLREKVTALALLPANNPASYRLEQLFQSYRDEAPEKFEYLFADPRKHPELAAKHQVRQNQTAVVLTRGEGENAAQATLQAVSEQELTNALLRLNSAGQRQVYFVVGHGEWPLDEPEAEKSPGSLSELKRSLAQEGYAAQSLNLAGQKEVPRDATLVVLAGPKSAVTAPEVALLRKYLEEGGRLAHFADVGAADSGLDELLAEYGVQVDPGVVADKQFSVQSPYVVLTPFFSQHEMVRLLKQAQRNAELSTARGLTVLRQGQAAGVKAEPVLLTSPMAWEESTPDDAPQPSEGEKTGQIALVVVSTRPTAGPTQRYGEARLVVFGDSELLLDSSWGAEVNRNLVLNALGWASQQVKNITVRPPDRDISTIDLDEQGLARVRFFATDLFPFGLLGVGLAIWITRRNR